MRRQASGQALTGSGRSTSSMTGRWSGIRSRRGLRSVLAAPGALASSGAPSGGREAGAFPGGSPSSSSSWAGSSVSLLLSKSLRSTRSSFWRSSSFSALERANSDSRRRICSSCPATNSFWSRAFSSRSADLSVMAEIRWSSSCSRSGVIRMASSTMDVVAGASRITRVHTTGASARPSGRCRR